MLGGGCGEIEHIPKIIHTFGLHLCSGYSLCPLTVEDLQRGVFGPSYPSSYAKNMELVSLSPTLTIGLYFSVLCRPPPFLDP